MNEENRNKLWEEYSREHSPQVREQIIIEYANLVKIVAGRLSMYLGYTVEYDDLVGYGTFGLIDAIDKFDLLKGVKFETYASLRIRGAILDQIRKMDWIPRTLRQKQKKIDQAYQKLELEHGRAGTDEEVADSMQQQMSACSCGGGCHGNCEDCDSDCDHKHHEGAEHECCCGGHGHEEGHECCGGHGEDHECRCGKH